MHGGSQGGGVHQFFVNLCVFSVVLRVEMEIDVDIADVDRAPGAVVRGL
jgi:hypothetical protein